MDTVEQILGIVFAALALAGFVAQIVFLLIFGLGLGGGGHVEGALNRDDIGEIDVFWGDDKAGLCHIIKERNARGMDGKKFAAGLAEVIEKGTPFPGRNPDRMNVAYKGSVAVIAFELRGTETTALLTAFYTKNKDRSPGEG